MELLPWIPGFVINSPLDHEDEGGACPGAHRLPLWDLVSGPNLGRRFWTLPFPSSLSGWLLIGGARKIGRAGTQDEGSFDLSFPRPHSYSVARPECEPRSVWLHILTSSFFPLPWKLEANRRCPHGTWGILKGPRGNQNGQVSCS